MAVKLKIYTLSKNVYRTEIYSFNGSFWELSANIWSEGYEVLPETGNLLLTGSTGIISIFTKAECENIEYIE